MKRLIFILALAALAVAVPVAFKFSNDANRLRQELSTQVDTITVVRTALREATDSLSNQASRLRTLARKLDNSSQMHIEATNQIARLAAKEQQWPKKCDSLQSLVAGQLVQLTESSNSIDNLRLQLAETSNALVKAHNRGAKDHEMLQDQAILIERIKPWYEKWRHDGQRGFIKVLFAAGKAPKPDFPEPAFPDTNSVIDPAAAWQASR